MPLAVVFIDGKVYALWKSLIDSLFPETPIITLQGGEEVKSLPAARRIWKKLWQYKVDKGQAILLIGGGSLLDVGGFCSSTWKRGIPFVSVPTTFIAQIDAAIGGKTGINFKRGKNLIGTFAEPAAIWIYPSFLSTLPTRELKAGWVEAFKHSLLEGGNLAEKLFEHPFSQLPSTSLIQELAQVKIRIVREDPYEQQGTRQLLNLGHTLGHLWESFTLSSASPLHHGEAVAIGIVQESWISAQRGLLSPSLLERIIEKLAKEKLLLSLPSFTWREWERLVSQDKKIRKGCLFMPLLVSLGKAQVEAVSIRELREAVRWYRHLVKE
ncbi:MAG: 3-dehydroquinate synthase family protein [Bacteroidia bacterium]|nr:3-dehydroquinate synthase [Bacteroidia bacterium]MDW8133966.1 3-dehydroquinate synthase family protein [Bacteroidia bacterium]